jgi:hypothetical protein
VIQHVYLSRATNLFRPESIGDLLRKSRENNERLGITGMLVYRHPFFMQVLEGPEDDVVALMARIRTDPRHTEITNVIHTPIARAGFADWSMAYWEAKSGAVPEIVTQFPGYNDFFAADFEPRLFAANPTAAKKLLLTFRDECLRPQVLPPLVALT